MQRLHEEISRADKSEKEILKNIIPLINADKGIINLINKFKESALHLAVQHNRIQIFKFLLDNGADYTMINAQGNTVAHIAAMKNQKDILQILLDKDIKIMQLIGHENETPLLIAASHKSLDAFKVLHASGDNIRQKSPLTGNTAAHKAASNDDTAMLNFIIEKDPELANVTNLSNQTPLLLTATQLKLPVNTLKVLLAESKRNNVNHTTIATATLRSAILYLKPNSANAVEYCTALVDSGANPSQSSGLSALSLFSERGRLKGAEKSVFEYLQSLNGKSTKTSNTTDMAPLAVTNKK